MQDENQTKIKNALLAIAAYVKVKGIRGLAKYLSISEGTIYAWVKRGKIGDTGRILGKHPEINPMWLDTAEGPMLRYQPPPGNQVNFDLKQPKPKADQPTPPSPVGEEAFDMPEMVKMTMEVLASDTVYRSALVSNIRAFHKAVNMEKEMKEVRQEIAAMAERMARMEEMLLSLGATLPEKRDKKAM